MIKEPSSMDFIDLEVTEQTLPAVYYDDLQFLVDCLASFDWPDVVSFIYQPDKLCYLLIQGRDKASLRSIMHTLYILERRGIPSEINVTFFRGLLSGGSEAKQEREHSPSLTEEEWQQEYRQQLAPGVEITAEVELSYIQQRQAEIEEYNFATFTTTDSTQVWQIIQSRGQKFDLYDIHIRPPFPI